MRSRGTRLGGRPAILRAAIVVAVILLVEQPATAFYWYGWPGSGVNQPPSLVPPTVQTITEVTTPRVVVDYPDVPSGPKSVPEPASLLAAVVGLTAVAVARRRTKGSHRRSP